MDTQAVTPKVERLARRKLATLREALSGDRDGLRDTFRASFAPGSLRFEPTTWLGRNVWKITGVAHLRRFTLESDPIGSLFKVNSEIGVSVVAARALSS